MVSRMFGDSSTCWRTADPQEYRKDTLTGQDERSMHVRATINPAAAGIIDKDGGLLAPSSFMYLNVPNNDWGSSSKIGQSLNQNIANHQKAHAAHCRSLEPNISPSSGVEDIR